MSIRFEGRVAIVTGAGNGLGRAHALGLAARGAKVVVNDLGGALDGSGRSAMAAERVAEEIIAAGGEAIADASNVADQAAVEAMVAATLTRFGRIDILINNAGILRDKSFVKMEMRDFRAVIDVHVMGAVHCTKAVWETMRTQNYGRVLFTTSSSGLYGNFGQANYATAKAALIGLMNTLHLEGAKYNIRLNALAPVAATRMTMELMPKEALGLLQPEAVTPGVLFLMSENAPSRVILAAGAGGFAVTHIIESEGLQMIGDRLTPEAIAQAFGDISDASTGRALQGAFEQTAKFVSRALEAEKTS